MLIDWFTVVAQVLNFLILVWLLKHFLYQPILDAIDAREKRIATEMADAAKKQKEANQERDDFNKKNADFDQQRNELLRVATEAANAERQRLLDEARVAADTVIEKRQLAMYREQQNLHDELARLTRSEVFSIARKTLHDLADTALEAKITHVFIARLKNMSGDAKSAFLDCIKNTNDGLRVRSAFELPDEQRAEIQQAVNEFFSADVPLAFESVENNIGGIELSGEGQTLAWSIDSYLDELMKGIAKSLAVSTEKITEAKKIKKEKAEKSDKTEITNIAETPKKIESSTKPTSAKAPAL
jgi:F-type H+-transporting ATPase subunit b